jgi:hypothetical protein
MKIFISHSSTNGQIAEYFVELLRSALPLKSEDIRCTSVDGYKLPAGAISDDQIKQEIFESPAFIALLSPTSMHSIYVMFELGARWGAKKYLAPIMVSGLMIEDLKPPLSAIHAISGTSDADVYSGGNGH